MQGPYTTVNSYPTHSPFTIETTTNIMLRNRHKLEVETDLSQTYLPSFPSTQEPLLRLTVLRTASSSTFTARFIGPAQLKHCIVGSFERTEPYQRRGEFRRLLAACYIYIYMSQWPYPTSSHDYEVRVSWGIKRRSIPSEPNNFPCPLSHCSSSVFSSATRYCPILEH